MRVVPFRRAKNPVVLCVDDEANALHVRRMVLERAGFTVLTAATAGEAMRLVRAQLRQRIDLVLTDYYLDGVSGGELARAIKDIDPHLNVAIYSGADDLPADAGNADRIIPKADGASALVGCIHSLLEGKRRVA